MIDLDDIKRQTERAKADVERSRKDALDRVHALPDADPRKARMLELIDAISAGRIEQTELSKELVKILNEDADNV